MRTYRELFGTSQFTPLFLSTAAQVAAGTLRGLALAVLVYTATDSALLSALSLFGAHFANVVGAMTLLSVADRVPPRAALVALCLLHAAGAAVLAAPSLPIAAVFVVIAVLGLAGSMGGGVRWGLLGDILPETGYVLGRSVFNMSVGAMQIAGFALGGALLAVTTPRTALLGSAALSLAAALTLRIGLTERPPRAGDRPSFRQTWRVNKRLWSLPARRYAYLAGWVPNGLVVGNEALFVPYRPGAAGILFIAGAAGMLAGDTVMGRLVPPGLRDRLLTPLQVLLGVPYLLFAFSLPIPLAAVAVAVASAGFSGGLILQQRLIDATPADIRGQALGLHSAGMFTMQAVGATIAGAVAQYTSTATAMVVMATLSIATSLLLMGGLRDREAVRRGSVVRSR